MECGKLTAKLRDAVPVCFIENGKEIRRFKNIEIPDEIKKLPYKAFEFSVPETGAITFKIYFDEGVLPEHWPEPRTRKHRSPAAPATDNHGYPPGYEPKTMEVAYNVTGDRRKTLVEAISAFVDAKPIYQNAPTFSYKVGDYTINKTGTVSGPTNHDLLDKLAIKGFEPA